MDNEILPTTLEEAIDILKVFFTPHIEDIKTLTENEFIGSTHFSAGMFVRNSWCLWWSKNHNYAEWPKEQPLLNAWFESIDIVHADDMSAILLTCLYRNLVDEDYKIKEQVDYYKEHWRQQGYSNGIPKH